MEGQRNSDVIDRGVLFMALFPAFSNGKEFLPAISLQGEPGQNSLLSLAKDMHASVFIVFCNSEEVKLCTQRLPSPLEKEGKELEASNVLHDISLQLCMLWDYTLHFDLARKAPNKPPQFIYRAGDFTRSQFTELLRDDSTQPQKDENKIN